LIKPAPAAAIIPPGLYLIFPVMWMLIYMAGSIYDGKKYQRAVDEFAALSLAMIIASILAAGVLYLSYREVSRLFFVLFIVLAYCVSLAWRILVRLYFRNHKDLSDLPLRRVLVVGDGPLGQRIRGQFEKSVGVDLSLVGIMDKHLESAQLLGRDNDIKRIVADNQVSDVVIALPYSAYHEMSNLVQRLDQVPVQIWIALGFFDLALYKTTIEDFAGIPMLDLRASAIDDYQRMLKRVFDLVFGSLGLLFALPFMALAALAIMLEDGRPIIFRQKRVGENGRVFEMLKFRTVVKNSEELRNLVEQKDDDGVPAQQNKDRNEVHLTVIGRALRHLRLDGLPQLFNVLTGTMSLVGPHPEMPFLVEKYQPWQRKRFVVPPGMTGWWQLKGRSDRPMHRHTEYDLYYIQNYSIWLDIQILARTVWVILIGKGSH
jgi:exopolysaccharide biosynthesis polyprenyl glycosylphosphotransferase